MYVTTTAAIYTIRFSITLVKFSSLFIPYSDVVENTMSDIQSHLYAWFQELFPIVLHILHLLFCEHFNVQRVTEIRRQQIRQIIPRDPQMLILTDSIAVSSILELIPGIPGIPGSPLSPPFARSCVINYGREPPYHTRQGLG